MQFSENSRVWIYQSDKKLADDVVQQLAGQLTHPVAPVAEQCLRIGRIAEVVGVVALDVHRRAAKEPRAHQGPDLIIGLIDAAEAMILSKNSRFASSG